MAERSMAHCVVRIIRLSTIHVEKGFRDSTQSGVSLSALEDSALSLESILRCDALEVYNKPLETDQLLGNVACAEHKGQRIRCDGP